jgi:hypothetical protein
MIKIIAIIAMIIDHIGYVFYPELDWLRIIGRIAFPLFAYQIAQGLIHTSNIKKYMQRLLFFGFVSIPPYYLLFDNLMINMILTFFLTVLIVYLWEKKDKKMLATLFVAVLFFVDIEFGIYGIITVILFKANLNSLFIPLTIGKSIVEEWYIQIFAILALPLIYYGQIIDSKFEIKINKWFYYWFYPSHLLILYIIQQLI